MTLEVVLAQLSRHPLVEGLLTVGSTGKTSFTPNSDYDILILLKDMPVPLQVGIVYIDHRLTDLLFTTSDFIDQILAGEIVFETDTWESRIAGWLISGNVIFDKDGRLNQVRAKLNKGNWVRPLEDIDAYGAWISINYNLLHTKRLIQSDDPVKQYAAELRMSLYGVSSVIYSYFRIRKLPWEGDKAAIRYLMAFDPEYFALLQQFLHAADPFLKFALYETIAQATLTPILQLWTTEPTVLWNDRVPARWETLQVGLAFWEELIG